MTTSVDLAREEPSPTSAPTPSGASLTDRPVGKFSVRVPPGRTEYRIVHGLKSEDVIVQTRIAGRIREGGVSVLDADTIQLTFGGVLNEAMDVVIIG